MKVKTLIKKLIEMDATGETEVCIGNTDILDIEKLPAYYDGRLQVLERDENCPYYNIIGVELRTRGDKIDLRSWSWRDAMWENTDIPVKYDWDTSGNDYYVRTVEEERERIRVEKEKIDREAEERHKKLKKEEEND